MKTKYAQFIAALKVSTLSVFLTAKLEIETMSIVGVCLSLKSTI